MLAAISHVFGARGLNIHNMLNKSKGEIAYTLVDIDSAATSDTLDALRALPGVLGVHDLPAEAP